MTQDPDNPDQLNTYSVTLAELGYLEQAILVRQRLRTLEPLVPLFNGVTSVMLWANGQTDAATALVPNRVGQQGALIAASLGRYEEATDLLQSLRIDDAVFLKQAQTAAQALRTVPSVKASPATLPQLGIFGWAYVYLGAPDRVMEYHEGNLKIGYMGGMEIAPIWAPAFAPVRKTKRFKNFGAISLIFTRTRSQPRNLLSSARSNNARSRVRLAIWSRVRMPQICFGLSGGFGPVKRDLFQGTLFGETCSEFMADLLADAPSHDGTGRFHEARPHTHRGSEPSCAALDTRRHRLAVE